MNPEQSTSPAQLYCPTCEKTFGTGERCPDDNTRLVRLGARDPLVGRELDGRYTIAERIGAGGMGPVYRAHQHSVGRDVAVKVVNTHLVAETDVVKRFLREAKLASKLGHPNAVSVLDFGQTDDGVFYLVMELVAGRTLDVVLASEPRFRIERVVKIGAQICDALEAAHALSIVHRDLKPSNVMLLDQGRDLVKVLDFGLAKSIAPDQTSTTMTGAGAVVGTPAFLPPELALGMPCDGRADLYSLGCMLYLMGSGRLPFMSDTAHDLMWMHAHEKAPPMHGVPQALADVVDRLLEKQPADRYQTAAETRAALEDALGSISQPVIRPVIGARLHSEAEVSRLVSQNTLAVAAAPTIVPVLPVAPARRRRWPWLVAALAVAGGAAVAIGLSTSSTSTPAPLAPAAAKPALLQPPVVVQPPPAPPVHQAVEPPVREAPKPPVTVKKPAVLKKPSPTQQVIKPPPAQGSGSGGLPF